MANLLVIGAHAKVYVNGQPLGRTIELRTRTAYTRREVRVLDALLPVELIQSGVAVGGSLRVYRMHNDGGAEAAGIVAPIPDQTLEKYFSLLVLDRVTDTVLFRADRCSLNDQEWVYQSRGYVIGSLTFSCITGANEVASKLTGGS